MVLVAVALAIVGAVRPISYRERRQTRALGRCHGEFKPVATIEVDAGADGFVFRAVEAREPAHV
jgi:hypothetical protein